MTYKITCCHKPQEERLIWTFLRKHSDFTLFLMNNLQKQGPQLTGNPNSGNYKMILRSNEVAGVFALFRRGNLILHAPKEPALFPLIADSCRQEPLVLSGLLGDWQFCCPFWRFLKEQAIVRSEGPVFKQVLYRADLQGREPVFDPRVRFLQKDDFTRWIVHRNTYMEEMSLVRQITSEEMRKEFMRKVEEQVVWGFFSHGKLASMADLNAYVEGIGQLGGVVTPKPYRNKGYAKALCRQVMSDCYTVHRMQRMIIFTPEENTPARRVYESLDVSEKGCYGALFTGL